jgi:hypothetical protein
VTRTFSFEVNILYIKLVSRFIKNFTVILSTLVSKRMRLKLATPINILLHY